ncbi:class A sortase [Vagococcus penaei]|uniref:Class A sortase n=1 Tax=Vagococcus penaei TaxID=633807 RepID=A0A1Q2D6S0_9ENTE|nr:class A sortase [Vagococcus penaei]
MKNTLINLLILCLLVVGLALVFNNQIKNYLVKDTTQKFTVNNYTATDIKKNQDKKATFDFEDVQSLDFNLVAEARNNTANMHVLGGIAIPSVDLNLPIFKGVSNYSIAIGAGTMKEDQVMGKGNYGLASHYMYDPKLLFAPLVRVEMGSSIYLTDLDYIYEYKVTMKEYVEPTRIEIIDDVPGKRLVTLVTCDVSGENRLIVQGELVKVTAGNAATKDMTEAFKLPQSN